MRMPVSVAIAGASGYAGGEVARLVLGHPDLELGALTAHSNAGEPVAAHQPHLAAHPAIADRTFAATTAAELAGHDVVVLALPHGASGAVASEIEATDPDCIVVDVGADHRLVDPQAWRDYYGSEHAGTWTYGMPELLHAGETTAQRQRAELAATRRIAVPGCNVTAVTLGLQPGIAAGLIEVDDVVAVLAVGYSGAGKAPKANLLASEALGSLVPYGVGGTHRHVPEILQNFGVTGASGARLSFTPVLVPTSRGIFAVAALFRGCHPPGLVHQPIAWAWRNCWSNSLIAATSTGAVSASGESAAMLARVSATWDMLGRSSGSSRSMLFRIRVSRPARRGGGACPAATRWSWAMGSSA